MLLQEEPIVRGSGLEVSDRPFIIGLVGASIFVVGTVMPAVSGEFQGGSFRWLSPSSDLAVILGIGQHPVLPVHAMIAGLVSLYAAATEIALVAIAGLRSTRKSRWGAAIAAASAIWLAPKLGSLINELRFGGYPFGVGAWAMYLGEAVAVAGGIVALVGILRMHDPEPRPSLTAVLASVLGVFAVAVYVFATTLTYQTATGEGFGPSGLSYTLYSIFRHQPFLGAVAAAFSIYGAASLIAMISLGGILGRRLDLWAMALLAAAVAWSPRLVALIDVTGAGAGFWGIQIATVMLLIAGAVAVAGSRRGDLQGQDVPG